jgi:hypothetical protein
LSERPNINQIWWHTLTISALGRLKQEDHKFEASLDYLQKFCEKERKKDGRRRGEGRR